MTTRILVIFPGSLKAQHIVFITLLKVFIHRLAHFPFHYVEELPPLFIDSKFIFARASSRCRCDCYPCTSRLNLSWMCIISIQVTPRCDVYLGDSLSLSNCNCMLHVAFACVAFSVCTQSQHISFYILCSSMPLLASVCVAVCVSTYRKCGIG